MSLPAILGVAVFVGSVIRLLNSGFLGPFNHILGGTSLDQAARARLAIAIASLAFTGLLALLLRFALANHRAADRPAGRVCKQLGWIVGSAAVGLIIAAAV